MFCAARRIPMLSFDFWMRVSTVTFLRELVRVTARLTTGDLKKRK